jgi:hypothetical protein
MAGNKSLGIYSLDEAGAHFNAALAVFDKNHDCASEDQMIQFFAGYMLFLNLTAQWNFLIDALEHYLPRLNQMGDDARLVLIQSRPQESEQDDKWSFCLTAGTLCPTNQER